MVVSGRDPLADKFRLVWPHLNERQRRLLAGAEAQAMGWGGVSAVSRAAGLSRPTVKKAIAELSSPPETALAASRSRQSGGPGVSAALDDQVHPPAGPGAGRGGPPRQPCASGRDPPWLALQLAGQRQDDRGRP